MSIKIVRETPAKSDAPRRQWRFNLPRAYEKGGYRQVGSFNAFFNGPNWRNKNTKNWLLYLARDENDHTDFMEFVETKTGQKFDQEPVDVADIYAFFKAIGYDYKTRRWSSQATTNSQ